MSQDNDGPNGNLVIDENLGVFVGAPSQTIIATDIICEGPIQGLVDGQASVFLDNDRAVPVEQSSAFHGENNSEGKVRLTNGSNVAVVQNLDEDSFNRATHPTEHGNRWLIVKDVLQGPITITIAAYNGTGLGSTRYNKPLVDAGEAYRFTNASATIPAHAYTTTPGTGPEDAKWHRYKPARLVAKETVNGETYKRTISGWIRGTTYNDASDDDEGYFLPGVGGVRSGAFIEEGDYDLYIDKIVSQSGSIVFPNMYLLSSWTFNPSSASVDFDFDLTSGLVNDVPNLDDSLITNYRGIQTQFRAGNLYQTPLSGGGQTTFAEGSTSISNSPAVSIDQATSYGGSQAPTELTASASTGFNLTAAQIPEVDLVKITFNYPALYAMNSEGNTMTSSAFYKVELALKRPGESDFDAAILLQEDHKHVAQSKNSLSFQIKHDMSQYSPFVDFKFIISRKTAATGDGYDHLGNRKTDWNNITSATIATTTAIIHELLSYPYTSVARIAWHTSDFQNTPKRSYHLRGSLVRVPSNYVTREERNSNEALYKRNIDTGVIESDYQDWDGSFRPTLVYTNNPAWVFYDILLNNRYGLGQFLEEADIDKYQLYRIGRYCDELVDNGTGVLEPRFTCNLFLTKPVDAFKVLKDMLTVFRGMLYFIDGQVIPQFDAPSGPVYNFSKSNVIDGAFQYEGTGSKTRINQVVVTWNNPDKNYKPEALLVEDRANIVQTGKIISQDSSAFGCTSEGQALRYGRWKLWTAANQTEIVSFATGLNGAYLRPGDVVNLQDADKAGIRYSGRIGSNVETGLTVSHTRGEGFIPSNGAGFDTVDRADNVVMAGEAILPSSFSQDECLMEYGGTSSGMWIGVRQIASEYKFVFRSGDGAPLVTATDGDTIIGEIPVDEIPEFDGGAHTIAWEIQPSAGKGYLWIDGRLIFSLSTTDSSALSLSLWAGSNLGGWGAGFGGIAGNYAATSWSGDLLSDLRVYNDQIASDKIKLDAPVTLSSSSTNKLSVVFVEPAAFLAQDTATINSVTYNRGDLIKRAYIDANGDGTYTFQKIDSQIDSINAKATQTGTDTLQLNWSEYLRVEQQTISNSGSNLTYLTTSASFEDIPQRSFIWAIQETDDSGAVTTSSSLPYKILAISEESASKYEITAVRYYDEKFDAIEKDFTTYVADPVSPAVKSTDPVPAPVEAYIETILRPGSRGISCILHWQAPESLATGTDNEYEHLSGFVIEHNIPNQTSPIRVSKDMRSQEFTVEEGQVNFTIRTVNVLGNRSPAVLVETTVEGTELPDLPRAPGGVVMGGISSEGLSFGTYNGNFSFHNPSYKFKSSPRSEEIQNTSTTKDTWQQTCRDMPTLTYVPRDGYRFEKDLFYLLFDASDSTDRIKLIKLYSDSDSSYWYDAGTGNGGRFSSNLTGTIIKPLGRSVVTGTGTSFTTELEIGDPLFRSDGELLGRVRDIVNDTQLSLDTANPISASSVNFKTSNLRIDAGTDCIIAAVFKTSDSKFNLRPFAFVRSTLFQDQGKRTTDLAYYWPTNSVQGGKFIETVEGASGTAIGTAPTTSSDSPVGRSFQNDDGVLLLSATDANTLETGSEGFAYSIWFKSESNTGEANARLLDRKHDNKYAIAVNQTESADDLQDLKIFVQQASDIVIENVVSYNKWNHLGISFDGTDFQVFLNGEEVYNETGYTGGSGTSSLRTGVNHSETGNKFIGKITEIKAYQKALSLPELYAEYNNPGGTVAGIADTDIQIGDTNGDVFKVTSDGISLGNTTFADAPFSVDMAGNLVATSGSFEGDVIADSLFANTEIVAPFLKVGKVEDNSIGVDALREEVFKEIEERLGTSGGYYGVFETGVTDSTDGYLGETSFTKEITNGGAGFEHEGETTYLTFTLHDQFSASRDISNTGREVNDLKLDVTLQKAVAGTSTWTDIGSTQRFTLDTNLIPYATQYTADFSIQSSLSTSGSHVVGTSYIYRVLLEAVLQADSDNRSMFRLYDAQDSESGANNAGGSPILLEIREAAVGLDFDDNAKAQFGAGNDLQIYHDGSDSYVDDAGVGDLVLRGNNQVLIRDTATNDVMVNCRTGQFVKLYYNNAEKLSTTSTGISVATDGVLGETAETGSTFYFSNNNIGLKAYSYITSNRLIPCDELGANRDDYVDLGQSNARFDDIYATNGTINTSDFNEKQDIAELSDAEQRVAVACKSLLRKFRWKSAVEEKGDEARTHFGIIAQDLQAAFEAEGLDASEYGMFISTTWTDEVTGEEKTRMGVRYSELLAFIIAAI